VSVSWAAGGRAGELAQMGRVALVAVSQMDCLRRLLAIGAFERGSNTVGPRPEQGGGLIKFNLGVFRGWLWVVVCAVKAAGRRAEVRPCQIWDGGRRGCYHYLPSTRHP